MQRRRPNQNEVIPFHVYHRIEFNDIICGQVETCKNAQDVSNWNEGICF